MLCFNSSRDLPFHCLFVVDRTDRSYAHVVRTLIYCPFLGGVLRTLVSDVTRGIPTDDPFGPVFGQNDTESEMWLWTN